MNYKDIQLFCAEGDRVRLLNDVEMVNSEILIKGTIFTVDEIVEFGFNLRNEQNNLLYRFINSSMFKYFEKVKNN